MFKENKLLNTVLSIGRMVIPRRFFRFAQPIWHGGLSFLGGLVYGFPSRNMKVIAITGTKGKSTTVFMITKLLEDQGLSVAAIGSLGYKIKDLTWPNTLKMTLPGRFKLQKFLHRARRSDCEYVVLEATSEGLSQNRLAGVKIDCAVYTNLHREHLESHGSFENYLAAKQKLFLKTHGIHVLNIEDHYFEKFSNYSAGHKITYGKKWGVVSSANPKSPAADLNLGLLGVFNEYNALAALAVVCAYGLDMVRAVESLNSIQSVPGRMEIFDSPKEFRVVVDYAHTPDSLELVYQTLKTDAKSLICVLGAAGGGRDKWKRSEFGRIAAQYCDQIILTNEDPYDENPEEILQQIEKGFVGLDNVNWQKIIDREDAIKKALSLAGDGDVVVITGKGSEISMALSGGSKIPWSDKKIVQENLT